jgi:recombinational DNA repair protein (RecF pathway)
VITKVEGIILSKTPFKDRHLICRVLLRSGEKISAIFYGGQGGGTKKKSSSLELGHLVKLELTRAKATAQIFSVKEWTLSWHHNEIRKNHKAFYILCFFLEVSDKVVVEANLFDDHYDDSSKRGSMFKVLSNGIFYLEKRALSTKDDFSVDLFIFLSKTLIEQGVFPERSHCVLSGHDLAEVSEMALLSEQGGFADASCLNSDMRDSKVNSKDSKDLWSFLCQSAISKYGDFEKVDNIPKEFSNRLVDYLCYQIQMNRFDFKSLSLIF